MEYSTQYTELACGTEIATLTIDPVIDSALPTDAPADTSQLQDPLEAEGNASGQAIDGDRNSQISGNYNNINYYGNGGGDGNDDAAAQSGGIGKIDSITACVVAVLLYIVGMF